MRAGTIATSIRRGQGYLHYVTPHRRAIAGFGSVGDCQVSSLTSPLGFNMLHRTQHRNICSSASISNGNASGRICGHMQIMQFKGSKYSLYTQTATRSFSAEVEPILDAQSLQEVILEHASDMSTQLATTGYYTTTNFLPNDMISLLRAQSIILRNKGRFEQSWSEKIIDGQAVRFDKEGVFACEPDGGDYWDAPDLIVYMSILLQTLPVALNGQDPTSEMDLSNSSFNAKLAVTSPGGSKYPLHIDNPQGLAAGDTRKLTCILYLNPDYKDGDGGELRIFLPQSKIDSSSGGDSSSSSDCDGDKANNLKTVDLNPEGGRLLLFWSDEIPHEVLATAPDGDVNDASLDRYALTVWIPTMNATKLHNESSKFCDLKDLAF